MSEGDSAPLGAPCWIDLFTSDPDRSRAFYGALFGWTAEEAGEEYGGYITHKGFGVLGEPGSPGWFELHTRDYDASIRFYREVFKWDTHTASDTPFRVDDADAALAAVVDLGGSVVMRPEDTPFGRLAQAADPTGAHFKLVAGA